jgi:hypothetical protein
MAIDIRNSAAPTFLTTQMIRPLKAERGRHLSNRGKNQKNHRTVINVCIL